MLIPFDPELAERIRKTGVEALAKMLVEVQPMTGSLDGVFENAKSETELIAEGYRPVDSQTRLMWVKDD